MSVHSGSTTSTVVSGVSRQSLGPNYLESALNSSGD